MNYIFPIIMPSEADASESDYEEFEFNLKSQDFTRLTEVVRGQYFNYLERQLEENLHTWQKEEEGTLKYEDWDPHKISIHKCAKSLEDLAIEKAIITQLYQRAMVKTIDFVRQRTREHRLVEQLAKFLKSNEQKRSISTETESVGYATKAIQTEEQENLSEISNTLSLDQRIDLFQNQIKKTQFDDKHLKSPKPYVHGENRCSKRRRISSHQRSDRPHISSSSSLIWHSPTPPPPSTQSSILIPLEQQEFNFHLEDDEVAQELEKIFTEQETDLDEIFGLVPKVNQTENIMETEFSNNYLKICGEATHEMPPDKSSMKSAISSDGVNISNSNDHSFPPPVKDLRYSLWPCECFMQKKRLSITLNRLVEEDIRWHDILKWQYTVLFGEEDVNDFDPCSPSIELNEVLKSSCVRRISPWVVRHLMKPLNDGLIGNRFLFKKFAKKLAHHIVMGNQYPAEYVIKEAIEYFFCSHRAVVTAEDLEDINMIPIENIDDLP